MVLKIRLNVENGSIYILGKDIDYILKEYDVQLIEYVGIFFEAS